MTIFDARSVSVSVAGKPLLQEITLTLAAGEIVALTGASGSGKTSLVRILSGLEDVQGSTIRLHDKTPAEWGWPVYRRSVLLVHQKPMLADISVRDNLQRAFAFRANQSQTFSLETAEKYLSQLHLTPDVMTQNARTLSVGQQQRVCVVRALLLKPSVLLLDEPTSALDADATSAVEFLLRDYVKSQNAAALVVTHNVRQASEWCDRVFDITPFRVEEKNNVE